MRCLATLALLTSAAVGQATGSAGPADTTVKELVTGLKAKETFDRVQAVKKAAKIDDDKVAKALAKALRDKNGAVRKAGVLGLRYMKNPTAFSQLLKVSKLFEKDKDVGPDYYLALGQRGDVKALPVLMHRAWNPATKEIFAARMKAVAHIRSPRSIQELITLNNKFRPLKRRANERGPTGYRLGLTRALELLTGRIAPREGEAWRKWMLEVKKVTKVATEPTGLTRRELAAYKQTWAEPIGDQEQRPRRRKRRRKRKK